MSGSAFWVLARRGLGVACKDSRAPFSTGKVFRASKASTREKKSVAVKEKERPEKVVYEKSPPLWVKGIWIFVGTTIIYTGSAVEFVWSRWTMEHPIPTPDTSDKPSHVLRPPLHRILASGFMILGGVALITGLFLKRAQVVSRIIQLTGSPSGKSSAVNMRIENAGNRKGNGRVVVRDECDLLTGKNDSEMHLRVPKVRGLYSIDLSGARINGLDVNEPLKDTRRRLQEAWYGVKLSHNLGTWKSGPVKGSEFYG